MTLVRYIQARNWPVVAGYVLFVSMMAVGYFYNVTFIQLGLVDLGVRVLGMSQGAVSAHLGLLALLTCLTALAAGWTMQRLEWGSRLLVKLQIVLAVIIAQTGLTVAAPHIASQTGYLLWIILCSLTLGGGVPATFSLTTDLIPVRDRGYVAAAITAAAYFLAAVFSGDWRIEALSRLMLLVMGPGLVLLVVVVGLATVGRSFAARWVAELAQNHVLARFGAGRFLRDGPFEPRQFRGFVALMFGIFFIDSLGFLRIIDTPVLVEGAWQSATLTPRLTIGAAHVITALIAGVLYTHLSQRHLFYWIFGIFALTHLTYTFRVWLLPETTSLSLGAPALYATAVSLYTVVNFAIWANFSTPESISWRTAVGVALSGWTATFLSTGLALEWQRSGVPLEQHLRSVNTLAQLFFLGMIIWALWPARSGTNET
jgi:MFS family permease